MYIDRVPSLMFSRRRVGGSRRAVARSIAALVGVAMLALGCGGGSGPSPSATPLTNAIRIGAVFPTAGNAAGLAGQELAGVQIAADIVNAAGGIGGRPIALDVRDLESGRDAPAVMAGLRDDGASAVIGAYSSDLSVAASQAANDAGLVYWEAGAVADRLTGRGLPLVFRVGASGANLGSNSAAFAASQLAPRLDRAPAELRTAIVAANDDYARSVADAAASTAAAHGVPIVARATYDLSLPDWPAVMDQLRAARADVIILASHIPDGVAFRRAMLAAGVHAAALIGSTMAECDPDFAGDLGPDAVGVFASDRPIGGFQPGALDPVARGLYEQLAVAWSVRAGVSGGTGVGGGIGGIGGIGGASSGGLYGSRSPVGPSGSPLTTTGAGYTITGPILDGSAAAGPSEEALSGFSAAWALFHEVLPAAAATGSLDATSIAATARAVDLPAGSLPNGAGLRFSSDSATLGQNTRAAAVIWQWQAVRSYTFVWPATYQTGEIAFVPLSR